VSPAIGFGQYGSTSALRDCAPRRKFQSNRERNCGELSAANPYEAQARQGTKAQ